MTDDGSTEVSYYHMDSDTISDTHKGAKKPQLPDGWDV